MLSQLHTYTTRCFCNCIRCHSVNERGGTERERVGVRKGSSNCTTYSINSAVKPRDAGVARGLTQILIEPSVMRRYIVGEGVE